MSTQANGQGASAPQPAREDDTLYQNGRAVARALDAQVDAEAREIRFREIYNSDELLLPDGVEYQQYRLLIRRVGFAAREDRGAAHKGRVLRDVAAEIQGYRQQ